MVERLRQKPSRNSTKGLMLARWGDLDMLAEDEMSLSLARP